MNEDLKKMIEERNNKQEEMTALLDKVKNEERAFTDEENALFDDLEKEITNINLTMEKINKGRKLAEEKPSEVPSEEKKENEERNMTNENIEKRELELFGQYIRNDVIENRAESTFNKGANGIIIPTTIADKIIAEAFDVSPILDKATLYKVKGKLVIPTYGKNGSDDITVDYAEDFTELTAKAGKFSGVTLEDYLVGALAKIGNSLINNTDIDLANHVIKLLADYVRRFLEGQVLKGSTDKIQGCKDIINKHEVSTPAITYDDLVRTKNKVKQAYRKGSFWVMNQDTATALELLKDTNGRPLFNSDPTGEFDGVVLGYPVYTSDNMDGIESGKRPIIFGNFSGLALKVSKKIEIQVLREKYATEHATGVVAWLEADAKIENYQTLASLDVKGA